MRGSKLTGHAELAGSLLTSEVTRRRARLKLGWKTAWEDSWVLTAVFPEKGKASALAVALLSMCLPVFALVLKTIRFSFAPRFVFPGLLHIAHGIMQSLDAIRTQQ